MSQSPLDQQFPFDDSRPLFESLRALALVIEGRLAPLEAQKPAYEDALTDLRERAREAINSIVAPLYEQGKSLASLGARLNAHSQTSLVVGTGSKSIQIDAAEREFFAASTWLSFTSDDLSAMVGGRLLSYSKETGILTIMVMECVGSGAHFGWSVSPNVSPMSSPAIVDGGTYDGSVENDGALPYVLASDPLTAQSAATAVDAANRAKTISDNFSLALSSLSTVNSIINASFQLNQRNYVSGAALAAEAFGHDRWKAGANGCTYTFSQSPADTVATITAGSLIQVVSGANIYASDVWLTWRGSAKARAWQGSAPGDYLPGAVMAIVGDDTVRAIKYTGFTKGAVTNVEFSDGSLGRVQLEPAMFNLGPMRFDRRLFEEEVALESYTSAQTDNAISAAVALVKQSVIEEIQTMFDVKLDGILSNVASYASAGPLVSDGSLIGANAPPGMPSGAAPRGIAWICDSTTPQNSVAVVTLVGGGQRNITLGPNYEGDRGYAAVSVTAVPGAQFQSLY